MPIIFRPATAVTDAGARVPLGSTLSPDGRVLSLIFADCALRRTDPGSTALAVLLTLPCAFQGTAAGARITLDLRGGAQIRRGDSAGITLVTDDQPQAKRIARSGAWRWTVRLGWTPKLRRDGTPAVVQAVRFRLDLRLDLPPAKPGDALLAVDSIDVTTVDRGRS